MQNVYIVQLPQNFMEIARRWNTKLLTEMGCVFVASTLVGITEQAMKDQGLIEPNLAPLFASNVLLSSAALYLHNKDNPKIDPGLSAIFGGLPACFGYQLGTGAYNLGKYLINF